MLISTNLQGAVASSSKMAPPVANTYHQEPSRKARDSSLTHVAPTSSSTSLPSSSRILRPIVDLSLRVADARASRQRLSAELSYYFEELRGYCPIHFGYHEVLQQCSDWQCDKYNDWADWSLYKEFKQQFRFAKYTYCYDCRAPNNSEARNYFALSVHEPFPLTKKCPWAHFVFRTIFVVWHRPDVSPALCEMFNAPLHDLDLFAKWASEDPSDNLATEYFNGLAFFMAYCRAQAQESGPLEHLMSMLERLDSE